MPKPKKERFVKYPPRVLLFKPQGIPAVMLKQVVLSVDEYEAIRLMDYENMDQEKAAAKMGISRATGARILESAHRKIADALSQGKAIRIEGGSYVLQMNRFWCRNCGNLWDDSEMEEEETDEEEISCPKCSHTQVIDLSRQLGRRRGGRRDWYGDRGYGPGQGRRFE